MNILDYIKSKIEYIILAIISAVIPQLVMHLAVDTNSTEYRMWSINSRYCSVLLLFFMLIYLAADYLRTKKKYDRLNSLIGNKRLDFIVSLPHADDKLEDMYKKLIIQMKDNAEDRLMQFEENKREDMEFIQTWVHEIKTPIAAAKLLIENGLDNPNEKVLYQISDEVERIEDMILKTICYSQLNDFEKDCQIDKISIKKVINKSLQSEYAGIHEKNIDLSVENIDFNVYSDEKWLGFIVKQLIDNAVKYSERDGHVRIYGFVEEKRKMLVIEDDGIGIRKEDLRRIFEKGYTGINGRDNVAATGIGLYLSNKLANKLEHKLLIESKQGDGTKASVVFKL